MNKLTIRAKVTLWYTLFMVVIVAVILGVLVEFSNIAMLTNQKDQLMKVVKEAAEEEKDDEDDDFEFWEDGIYLIKYDSNQQFLEGSFPSGFPSSIPILENQLQTLKYDNQVFYVFDRQVQTKNGEVIWLRGITSSAQVDQMSTIIIGMAFVLLPILVITSSFIGYHITKKAFEPVKKIQETAQQITESQELSMRIGLPDGRDEISKLGKTVDEMLNRLEKSFEQEKQFTADASHELRTPITVILTESEYVLSHVKTMEDALESIEVINRQANKMSELINQLLFFARAENGTIKLNYERVNIPVLIGEIVETNQVLAEQSNILISIKNEMKEEFNYFVDKILFSRAIQNIIENAISYGNDNGMVEVRLIEMDNYWGVKVMDDGIGIKKDNLEKIWNRFYQVNEARNKTKRESMGLGLSMVKWIVDKHKGYVEVESTPFVGSIFSLYFPKKQI